MPRSEWSLDKYPKEAYAPIGIVVVPGSHNVYGDGTCGVMSLKYMNYTTPNEGSTTTQNMCWGGYNVETSLKNYTDVPSVGSSGIVNSTIQGVSNTAYLPSDAFSRVDNPNDPSTKYHYNDSYDYAPSSYVKSEDSNEIVRNPLYYQATSPSSTANCLSDFDGVNNTEKLMELVMNANNSDWATAKTIENKSGIGYYPAACCCWRYSTEGTKQGDWYLPAAGEFGYVVTRLKAINETIAALSTAYGSTNISSVNSHFFWSSTEYGGNSARCLDTYSGYVGGNGKGYDNYVRAFLRV